MRIVPWLAGLLAMLLLASASWAQVQPRKIPANATRGTYSPAPFPGAYIDGKLVQMAAGVRIIMPNNLTVPPNQVPADTPIRYELDPQGKIRMIWVLTPEEARRR